MTFIVSDGYDDEHIVSSIYDSFLDVFCETHLVEDEFGKKLVKNMANITSFLANVS